ncbi:hypothetical protein F442_18282 [Phytophthora nicotianae P10297]|uniref:Uncharacterized protein n=1 Tax=Phytophthora nicotianae P10297 TaxID=1317064 RepID=W2YG23_PHYNI|nr:hypothetical protein F442_18282 [Phytophthora nicotianae P10297]
MDRCWGISATADEGSSTARKTMEYSTVPRALGKRHASIIPVGLDEVLESENAAANITRLGSSEEATAKPRRTRKHRKSTHVARKEEKERLLNEMAILNAQLESLKQQAMASMDHVDQETTRSIQVGRKLRYTVHRNQQKFGEVASIMSEISLCNAQAGSPLHDKITLKRDQESRRKLLRELKASKISKGEHFLRLRRPNTNLRSICDEGRRFEMGNGDFFSERLSITQLKDARSVKQIYDLLVFYYSNIEISISEKIGHITVRLDDDAGSKSIIQNRLRSTTIDDLKVESNTIIFAQFYEQREGDYGVIVLDYVEDDEKYPYQRSECLRKDVVAVMEVRECPQSTKDDGKTTVVLTRWVQNKLRRPEFSVSIKHWNGLCEKMDMFGKTVQLSLAEDLYIEALGLGMPGN